MVASKATPMFWASLRAAAAVAVTAVPCPSSSASARLSATSRLAGSIRPANSASDGLMPLSTTASLMPWPVAPLSQAVMAPELTAPFERSYSAVSKLVPGGGGGGGGGVVVGGGVRVDGGGGIDPIPPPPPPPPQAESARINPQAVDARHQLRIYPTPRQAA